MSAPAQAQTKAKPATKSASVSNHARSGLLLRKCACGESAGLDGACPGCREKKLTVQRKAMNGAEPSQVPPTVRDVVNSSGQSLDSGTRAYMEPRFGYNFSNVRVHTDASAAKSARAVNALAYTVGRDVVFGSGQYQPGTTGGRQLLAHELTHVVQQRNASMGSGRLQLAAGTANEPFEREAERVANRIVRPTPSIIPIGAISSSPALLRRQEDKRNSSSQTQSQPQSSSQSTATSQDPSAEQPASNNAAIQGEAKDDAQKIMHILKSRWINFPAEAEYKRSWRDIMVIIEKWAKKPIEAEADAAPFDYFLVALQSLIYPIRGETVTVYDQLLHLMPKKYFAQLKNWIRTQSRVVRKELSIKLSEFYISEAKHDALEIKHILEDNTWLGEDNQDDIMKIIKKWANIPTSAEADVIPFDYFLKDLRSETLDVGWFTTQYSNVFDQLFHRMNKENVAELIDLMRTRSRVFKNDQVIEEFKSQFGREDFFKVLEFVGEALEVGVELTGAVATGGGSVLLQIASWVKNTLPGLYDTVTSIFGFVNAISSVNFDDVKKLMSPGGVAELLVKALFGELEGLTPVEKGEQEAEKEPAEGRAESGIIWLFHSMMRIFNTLKKTYAQVVEFLNESLGTINITTKPWFEGFSIAYFTVAEAAETAGNWGATLLRTAAKGLQDVVGGFFEGMRTKVSKTVEDTKSEVDKIGNPVQWLKLIADKAVEMVLNFIISNPPSALVRLAFKAIEVVTKKSILELVRKHIPFADWLINKIAESDTVQKILTPLKEPVTRVIGVIDSVSDKVLGVINDVENRTVGFVNEMIKELIGAGPTHTEEKTNGKAEGAQPEQEKAEASPKGQSQSLGDFLGVIKHGIHTRLMKFGQQNLRKLRKYGKKIFAFLRKAVLKKGKEKVKGLL